MGCLSTILYAVWYYTHVQVDFCDGRWRYQECAYTLSGINPFDIISGQLPPVSSIGALPNYVGTVPWALTLGNAFAPSCIPWNMAFAYSVLLTLALAVIAWRCVYGYIAEQGIVCDGWSRALCASAIFIMPYWVASVGFGNHATPIFFLIVIAITQYRKHDYLCAILLALAMCKPQMTLPFFVPILMERRWRLLFTSVGIVLAGWVIAVVRTGTEPLEMLSQLQEITSHYSGAGFLSFLTFFGVSPSMARVASFGASLVLIAGMWGYFRLRKIRPEPLALFSLMAVISVIWTYKQMHDWMVMAIPLIYLFLHVPGKHRWACLSALFVLLTTPQWCQLGLYIKYDLGIRYVGAIPFQLQMFSAFVFLIFMILELTAKKKEDECTPRR